MSNPILLAPRALLGSLISFEALLVLYMFAGFYKGDPRFAWIPVDPTGLFFALSAVVGSFIIVRNPIHKKALPVIGAMVCLVVWFLISLTWSPSRVYGPDKVFLMATLELWAVIAAALIIAPDPERVRRLFSLLLLLSLWVGIEALLVYGVSGGGGRVYVGSANYLLVGRVCGLGALVALAAWLYSRRPTSWLCLGLFLGLGVVLVIGGARGPLLATSLALLIPAGLSLRLTPRRFLYWRTLLSVVVLLLTIAGGFSLYVATSDELPLTLRRFERFLAGVGGDLTGSEGVRADLYTEASDMISRAPLIGHGAGSWPLLTGRPDNRAYPHNMFLEVVVETGLIGLVFLLALFATALRPVSFERLRRDPQALCAMMLFANTFFNAMVTEDLPGNRPMFMLIGVLALFAVRRPVGTAVPAPARAETLEGGTRPWGGRGFAPVASPGRGIGGLHSRGSNSKR